MRQISVDRSKAKVRGKRRRMQSLEQWADSFAGYFSTEFSAKKYWNWKLPVLDSLVSPPTTRGRIQRQVASLLIRAATHLADAKPDSCRHTLVTALKTFPSMFGSELCVFFDRECFSSFFDRDSKYERLVPTSSPICFELPVPRRFDVSGYDFTAIDDDPDDPFVFTAQWWSIREAQSVP